MEEKILKGKPGIPHLILFTILYLFAIGLVIVGGIALDNSEMWGVAPLVIGIFWLVVGAIPFAGLKIIRPQEALVLTLFGKYTGTIKGSST